MTTWSGSKSTAVDPNTVTTTKTALDITLVIEQSSAGQSYTTNCVYDALDHL